MRHSGKAISMSFLPRAMQRRHGLRRCGAGFVAALLATSSMPAYAQEGVADAATADDQGSEIVITATRQDQALSKVPLSVVAITPKDMDARGIRDISDIARQAPGLALTPLGGGNDVAGTASVISIRGVSSNVGSATTGIYIDDTPIQTRSLGNATANAYPQLFDLERVEVLRGPQGTLFGAGAEGGAVRFITPKPGLQRFSGFMRGEVAFTEGGAPTFEGGGAIGGPLVQDKAGFRASAWFRSEGGYIDRTSDDGSTTIDKNANKLTSYVLRGAVKLQASERLSATLSLMHQKQTLDDVNSFYTTISDPEDGEFRTSHVLPSEFDDRFTLPAIEIEYEGDGFDVIANGSYFDRTYDRYVDYTKFISSVIFGNPYLFLPGEYAAARLTDGQQSWSGELRAQSQPGGRLNWVFGVYYGDSKQTTDQINDDPSLNALLGRFGIPPFPLLQPGDHGLVSHIAATDKQLAGYGQLEYEIIDGLKVQAGLRVAQFKLSTSRSSAGPVAGGAADFADKSSETPITPKFGISYQATPDTLIYASASKGYRIGGINGPQLAFCDETLEQLGISGTPETYDSDSLWSYEGGVKSKLAGGRLSVAASVFHIDWKNIQQRAVLAQCFGSFIVNVGSAQVTGFDLAADFRASDNLTLGGSFSYANAHLTDDFAGPTPPGGSPTFFAKDGDKIGGPPVSFMLYGEYGQDIGEDQRLYGRVDYQHLGRGAELDYTLLGFDPLARRSDAYDQVALRVGLRTRGIDVSAFVNNLLDEAPLLTSSRATTFPTDDLFTATTLRPRTFGVTATYRY